MIYKAIVVGLGDDIEEEVTLLVNGVAINCFASVSPYPIKMGLSYPVSLELVVLSDYVVEESPSDPSFVFLKTGKGFAYHVRGKLNGGRLEVGPLVFQDEVLQRDFSYLDGKFVTLSVDRIDVEFLVQ